MMTEEIKAKIDELKKNGLSIRKIASQLNIPLHHVNHYIYRKTDYKPKDHRESQTKKLIQEVEEIKNLSDDLPRIAMNPNTMKAITHFSEFHTAIDDIISIDGLKRKIVSYSHKLVDSLEKGALLDKQTLQQFRILTEVYERVCNGDKNTVVKFKEMLSAIAGSQQAGLIPKQIHIAEKSEEEREIELQNLIQFNGIISN